jgi:hypothetical protein
MFSPFIVKSHFGSRVLTNPLGASSFGHATIMDAEASMAAEDEAGAAVEAMTLDEQGPSVSGSGGGGAAAKFRKKEKKKKKKNKNF